MGLKDNYCITFHNINNKKILHSDKYSVCDDIENIRYNNSCYAFKGPVSETLYRRVSIYHKNNIVNNVTIKYDNPFRSFFSFFINKEITITQNFFHKKSDPTSSFS